eukprot:m.204670 g.204670  ORF g.204670 m.204670 type:complete len:556 (+) comp15777_c0_seq3:124-1791(+)
MKMLTSRLSRLFFVIVLFTLGKHTVIGGQVCGVDLACPEKSPSVLLEKTGQELPFLRVASVNSSEAASWSLVQRQYRLRHAGIVSYDVARILCNSWSWPEDKGTDLVTILGYVIPTKCVAALAYALVCWMLAFLCFLIGEILTVTYGNISIASRIRTKLMTLFIWTFILVSMFPVAMMMIEMGYFQETQDSFCKTVFGEDFHTPPWSNHKLREHYVLFSNLKAKGHEKKEIPYKMIGQMMQAITLNKDSPLVPAFQLVCGTSLAVREEFSVKLQSWIQRGGLSCHIVRDSDSQLVTVYIEHALMTVNHVQLILESEGKQIIQLAEQHAKAHGWTTKRHDSYATTDIPVASTRELSDYLTSIRLKERVESKISEIFNLTQYRKGVIDHESFVVKYDVDCANTNSLGCGQGHLDAHRDGSEDTVISYNILLNDAGDFDGGGTFLQAFNRKAAISKAGYAVTHPSKLRHGGAPVKRGQRYILVGFMVFDSLVAPTHRQLQKLSDNLSVRFPESLRYVQDHLELFGYLLAGAIVLLVTAILCFPTAPKRGGHISANYSQ